MNNQFKKDLVCFISQHVNNKSSVRDIHIARFLLSALDSFYTSTESLKQSDLIEDFVQDLNCTVDTIQNDLGPEKGYDLIEGFVKDLRCTVRECIDCGCLTPGGPTRCKRCAKEYQDKNSDKTIEWIEVLFSLQGLETQATKIIFNLVNGDFLDSSNLSYSSYSYIIEDIKKLVADVVKKRTRSYLYRVQIWDNRIEIEYRGKGEGSCKSVLDKKYLSKAEKILMFARKNMFCKKNISQRKAI
jgi:hypothetical protein